MAVVVENLMVAGPAGLIEARLESNENVAGLETHKSGAFDVTSGDVTSVAADSGAANSGAVVAVICHPHPQFQGTMLNKVVHTLSRACTDLGVPALRFNYRGVGKSEGSYDNGRGETDDAAAAVAYMLERFPNAAVILAGFSFGSGVVLRLAQRQQPLALITVAPPVGRLAVPDEASISCPWLVVQGTADELVDWQRVDQWAKGQERPPELLLMPDVSHFFHGKLTVLRESASRFLKPALSSYQAGSTGE